MAENDKFLHPGDTALSKLELTNFDGSRSINLKPLSPGFVIKESIFENCMHGTINVYEGLGHHQLLPIVGEETFGVAFQTHSNADIFDHEFRVYKMNDLNVVSNMNQAYQLQFASQEFLTNEQFKLHRSYKDRTVKQIVEDLFKFLESDKKLKVGDTVNNQNIVIPDLKPIQAINMLAQYAQAPEHKGSLFLFFENNRGFQFESVQSLFQQKPKAVYKRVYSASQSDQKADAESLYTIEDFSFRKTFDVLMGINGGMYYNSVLAYDMVAKKFVEKTFNYADEFGNLPHVDKGFPLKSDKFSENKGSPQSKFVQTRAFRGESSYFKDKNGTEVTYTPAFEETLPYRLSLFQQLTYTSLEVVIPGNTDLAAGDVITIDLPPYTYADDAAVRQTHALLKGNYLITTIQHEVSVSRHKMKLKLVRDVYTNKPKLDA